MLHSLTLSESELVSTMVSVVEACFGGSEIPSFGETGAVP